MSTRLPMPPTRQSITHKFSIAGAEAYLIVGLNGDGQPLELFIKIAKSGSTLSGLTDSFARALSLALRHGLPLTDAIEAFKDMRFEPLGSTSNPQIPEALSLVDYVVRWLEIQFISTEVST